MFGDFNNNLFILNFWVKFTEINAFNYLEIKVDKKKDFHLIGVLNYLNI